MKYFRNTGDKNGFPMTSIEPNKNTIFSQSRVEEIINQVVRILDYHLGAKENYKLYLFGSRAKNENNENADIDLAISCAFLSENQLRKIKRKIADLRTLYSIDLVHLETVDRDFRSIILADAREIDE